MSLDDIERFRVGETFDDYFHANGFAVVSDLLDLDELLEARRAVFALFRARFDESNEILDDWRFVLESYESDLMRWRQAASRMHCTLGLLRIAGDPRVRDALVRIGLMCPITSTFPEIRTDLPEDENYTQPWHQDWRYGQSSWNSITIWAPLHDVTESMGAIWVIPGSHLNGCLPCEEITNPRRFKIDDKLLDTSSQVCVELKFGELVVFSQMLVHRSGRNTSGKLRLTCQLRYADATEQHFRDNGYKEPPDSELLWRELPDRESMWEIHSRK